MVDFGKLIPARGEAEVMARLKGGYGGKMRGRRSSMRGRRSAMRSGRFNKKHPKWMLPTAPGDYTASLSYGQQKILFFDSNGALQSGGATGADQGWLFAMTPEILARSGLEPYAGLAGDSDTQYDRLRIVGMTGKLFWTPFAPVSDPGQNAPYDPSELTGTIIVCWYKVEAHAATIAGGYVNSYPWASFSEADAAATANIETYLPGIGSPTFQGTQNVDFRFRAKLMSVVHKRWTIGCNIARNEEDASLIRQLLPHPIEIPLPRKLICNIGKGEALGCAYYIRNDGTVNGVGGAPSSRFSFESMRVKCFELD